VDQRDYNSQFPQNSNHNQTIGLVAYDLAAANSISRKVAMLLQMYGINSLAINPKVAKIYCPALLRAVPNFEK